MTTETTRRRFLKTAAAASALTALSQQRVHGANERIRAGFIGVGNRGGQLLDAAGRHPEIEVVAMCDVYAPYLEDRASRAPGQVQTSKDFRELLENPDLDVVFIATPDHWHAIQTIQACQAGKDVYVEKPLSLTIHEGRAMVEAARKYDRVVQAGTQRASRNDMSEIQALVQEGRLGRITLSRAARTSNMAPTGIGREKPCAPPPELDWDLWLGPARERPYQPNIAPYKFRWWREYSSQLGNWGVHYFDNLRAFLGVDAPVAVTAQGGNYAVDDDRTIPDTMEVVFELPKGGLLTFGVFEGTSNGYLPGPGMEVRGTQATLYANWESYRLVPERPGQFQSWQSEVAAFESPPTPGDQTFDHINNFVDCVKSRQRPVSDVEAGHLSTTFSHLGNIAFDLKTRLVWDARNEQFMNNETANQKLHYEYRAPWKLG